MGFDVLKIILLHGIRDDFLDMLNMLGKGDISKESPRSLSKKLWNCVKGTLGDLPGITGRTNGTN